MKSNKSKNFFREIAFLAVLNFFPVQKLMVLSFLKLQKMEFGQKKFFVISKMAKNQFLNWGKV